MFNPISREDCIAGGPFAEDTEWTVNPEYDSVLELRRNGQLVAWIEKRPVYCDRGHYRAQVEVSGCSWDEADGRLRYYMMLEVAKQEIIRFVNWRLFQIRGEPHPYRY